MINRLNNCVEKLVVICIFMVCKVVGVNFDNVMIVLVLIRLVVVGLDLVVCVICDNCIMVLFFFIGRLIKNGVIWLIV